jgi:hypothetical protein
LLGVDVVIIATPLTKSRWTSPDFVDTFRA